jgi:ABC-type Zn uptake system ZnuABC Zn-binding protein ZnuA
MHPKIFAVIPVFLLVAAQCGTQPGITARVNKPAAIALDDGEELNVVATTSIVGDIVKNVGGDEIDLTVLLPLGADPHSFSPTPADLAAVADAHVVFVNGLGLEEFLDEMIKNAGGEAMIVEVSSGIEVREFGESEKHEAEEHGHEESQPEGEEHEHDEEERHRHHEGVDPHAWMTPANAAIFADNIEHGLSQLDPKHTATYAANTESYQAQLADLDAWVKEQIDSIPPENRKVVTDHDTLGYYTDRYGLEMVGAVLPGFSTSAEPSAQELAALQDAIDEYGVKVVFVGTTINPVLAERIAEDTSIQLVPLYTGSLGEAGSGAEAYIDYIRYNTRAIVEALK